MFILFFCLQWENWELLKKYVLIQFVDYIQSISKPYNSFVWRPEQNVNRFRSFRHSFKSLIQESFWLQRALNIPIPFQGNHDTMKSMQIIIWKKIDFVWKVIRAILYESPFPWQIINK